MQQRLLGFVIQGGKQSRGVDGFAPTLKDRQWLALLYPGPEPIGPTNKPRFIQPDGDTIWCLTNKSEQAVALMLLESVPWVWTDDPALGPSIDDFGLLEPASDGFMTEPGQVIEMRTDLACQMRQRPSRTCYLLRWRLSSQLLCFLDDIWRVGWTPSPAPRTRSRGNGVNTSFVEVLDHLAHCLNVYAKHISDPFASPVAFCKAQDSGTPVADYIVSSLPPIQSLGFFVCDCA